MYLYCFSFTGKSEWNKPSISRISLFLGLYSYSETTLSTWRVKQFLVHLGEKKLESICSRGTGVHPVGHRVLVIQKWNCGNLGSRIASRRVKLQGTARSWNLHMAKQTVISIQRKVTVTVQGAAKVCGRNFSFVR